MATKTAEGFVPTIKDAKEMPRPRRGRKGMDLTPFIEKLSDNSPHTMDLPDLGDDDENKKERDKWARRLRAAGERAGVEVETAFIPEENALYFRGWEHGNAPARGRRSSTTRKETKTSTKSTAKASAA